MKKTMTLNLSGKEMQALEGLCEKKGMNKTMVIKQALRFYQSIDSRMEKGEKFMLENPLNKEKTELFML